MNFERFSRLICIRILVVELLAVTMMGCEVPATVDPKVDSGLVWSEEFETSSVDPNRWTFEIGNGQGGWGNQEWQYYRAENTSLRSIPGEEAQALVITAKKETFGGREYTSSRLKTQGKASWTYGKIEARLKLPEGQGIWPAFWMLGESISTVGWPRCGEIDIMEMIGGAGDRDRTTYGTAHWDDGGRQYRGGSLVLPQKLSSGFHVYTVDWTPRSLTWSVDGELFFIQPITGEAFTEFHQPAFLLLNLAVGGQWPGYPDATTVFPQEFWVDWIRVYQSR